MSSTTMTKRPSSRDEFRVAIICALLCEFNAVSRLFDSFYDLESDKYGRAMGDQNTYLTGRIGPVDAVLVRLSEMGKAIAASATASLRSSFPRLEVVVLTGICGGVPYADANGIVLGDVILAKTVVQYDLGREYHDGFVAKTAVDEALAKPRKPIINFLSTIESDVLITYIGERIIAHLGTLQTKPVPKSSSATYQYPGIEQDKLFEPTHLHKHQSGCERCKNPNKSCHRARQQTCDELECGRHGQLVERTRLKNHHENNSSAPLNPSVFFGCIGSGDKVIKSGQLRDTMAKKHKLVAFEMEGAGVWEEFPCIIVKSVCDYADSHKNKQWQNYAAATAAAATKALLERYPRTDETRSDLDGRDDAQLLPGDNTVDEVYQKQVTACRGALSLREPVVDLETLKSKKGHRVKGTCTWIKDNEKYQSWLGGDSQCLWISGGPGKGKTMLSIFLTEELERHTQATKDAELLFYFCDHQDENRNSAVAVLRSLVCQLLTKRPHLMKSISNHFESDQKTQTTVSSAQALWVVFQTLLQADVGTVLCVIDGLDECDGESTSLLVAKFCDFFSPGKSNKMLKLAIVSRKLRGLEAFRQVNLDHDNEGHVSDDITNFISAKVEELGKVEGFGQIRKRVETTLRKGANGTFLWVSLVIKELLKKTTCTEILESLKEFPPGLDAIYSRMLQKMKKSPGLVASKILRWVVMATRPLTLSELAEAVRVKPSENLNAEKVMSDYIILCEPMLKVLKVLKVGEEKKVVDLAHQSARDYLLRPMSDNGKTPREFLINTDEAHSELLGVCLDCIESSDLRDGPLLDTLALQKSPLLDYALQCWPEHARHSSAYVDEHLDLSRPMFCKQSDLRTYWWVSYWRTLGKHIPIDFMPPGQVPNLPLLHLASFLGIEWLARKVLPGRRSWRFSGVLDDWSNTPLFYAINQGHETVVRLLLEKGFNLNMKSGRSPKPLFQAVWHGNCTILKLLLAKKANVDEKDEENGTALIGAAILGYDTVAKLLIEHGADVNAANKHGNTALIHATIRGSHVIVKLLIEKGANVNAADKDGNTALTRAATCLGDDVMKTMLRFQKGADMNATNSDVDGNTALMSALESSFEIIIRLLIENGANLNVVGNNGITALRWAAHVGKEVIVKLLLEKGANLNAEDAYGFTALLWAIHGGKEVIVKLLLEKGADVNTVNLVGQTGLIYAASNGHEVIAKLLLEKGVDVNAVNFSGETALIYAASNGHDVIAKLLIEKGADVNAVSKHPCGRMALICEPGAIHVVTPARLIKKDADVNAVRKQQGGMCYTALMMAARSGHDTSVKLLLENGACINAKDESGRTALIYAALKGHDTTVKLLLANGADVNVTDQVLGGSALHVAVEDGHENMVKLLLQNGANINDEDSYGRTVLMEAALEGSDAMVKLLLANGADINLKDSMGGSALGLAAESGHENIVKLLVENGANVNDEDNYGRSALIYAALKGHDTTVELLLANGADINAKDGMETSALELAAERGHENIVKLLEASLS